MPHPDSIATRQHWDALAESYDDAKRRNDVYYRALKHCFDNAVPSAARGRVLEVGCGTGQIIASLRPLNGVGIDISEKMIEQAQQQFASRSELTFAVMDAAAIGGLGEFDAVVSADVMEHVPQWRDVVRAMVAACRAGGIIAISTPNPLWALLLWILEHLKLKMPEGPHRFVAARAIAQELAARGCRVESIATHLILPMKLGGLGPRISNWARAAPVFRRLGVIQMIVATRQ